MDDHLLKRWAAIKVLLDKAVQEIPLAHQLGGAYIDYFEFVKTNELGLALDSLIFFGQQQTTKAPKAYWSYLKEAALLMENDEALEEIEELL